ncbi:MAG: GNAT family N-acetyltransferase [Chloroflexi bacterium]|nr:GNAT family N-acetyltransferase [Chloroflexota bacterium]
MTLLLRDWQRSDVPFLRKMLYEAVFWRPNPNKPSFEEGAALPEVRKALADWGEREGDTAVVATINSIPIGAAWYRTWTDDNFINGYINEKIPVIVIGVHHHYRHQGIGGKMMDRLIDCAAKQSIPKISLSVSKDNVAINLYRQQGFVEHADIGDAFLMVRQIKT